MKQEKPILEIPVGMRMVDMIGRDLLVDTTGGENRARE